MSRSESSIGRVASARSSSRSVSADMRRAISTHARMPSRERSLVYAKPSRCSSKTRTPMPRSPRAMTASIAPSLISTDPDWASRRNTSPVAPVALSASRAASTVASLVRRSLMRRPRLAGGTGERGVREPRVPRGPATRSERSERRDRWGGCGERTALGAGAPSERSESATGPARPFAGRDWDLVRGFPGEGDVGDEGTVGFEGPSRVVREVAWRSGEATKDHGRPHDLFLAHHPHERRRHPDELLGAFATLELSVTAGKLDGDLLGADRGGLLGVVRLERR